MYKFIIAFMCCISSTYACDFCGCAPSIMNGDLLSVQPQSSVGINTNYTSYKYLNNENGLTTSHLISTNIFASYAPKKWVELRATLPIIWMMNKYPNLKDKTYGIGDMSIVSNFKVLSKSPIGTNKKVGHTVILGFGVELPTGKNKFSSDNQLQNFTLGSRSTDFLFSGVYSMSYRKWNIITAGLVKINTKNKEEVRYGHLYNIQLATAYTHTFKSFQLVPNLGLRTEIQQKNLHKNIIQNYTGRAALFLQYGVDVNIKDWNLGVQIQHPIYQKTAMNTIKQQSNFLFKISYLIKKKQKTIVSENAETK